MLWGVPIDGMPGMRQNRTTFVAVTWSTRSVKLQVHGMETVC